MKNIIQATVVLTGLIITAVCVVRKSNKETEDLIKETDESIAKMNEEISNIQKEAEEYITKLNVQTDIDIDKMKNETFSLEEIINTIENPSLLNVLHTFNNQSTLQDEIAEYKASY